MNYTNTHHLRIVNIDFLNKNIPENIKSLPKITKLCVNGKTKSSLLLLEVLAHKKSTVSMTKDSKSQSSKFNISKTDLRKKFIYDFLDRFIFEILPSSKEISVLNKSNKIQIKDAFAFNEANILYSLISDTQIYTINFESKIKNTKFFSGFRLPVMDE